MKNIFKTGVFILSLAVLTLTSCKKDDFVQPEELNDYVKTTDNGYIQGTISGTRLDGTPYSFPFDYTSISRNRPSVSISNGDKILYFNVRYKNALLTDNELNFSGSLNFTKKTFTEFTSVYGYFSQVISSDKRFLYGFDYDPGDTGTYNWSNIAYDENTEMLTADFTIDMPENNVLGYDNTKATKITGKIGFLVSKTLLNTYQQIYMAPTK